MTVVAWVILVFFGLFMLHGMIRFYNGSGLNWFHTIVWFFSAFMTAVSAGILFGNLQL